MNIRNFTPSFSGFYPNFMLAAVDLFSETMKFHIKNDYFITRLRLRNYLKEKCNVVAAPLFSSAAPEFFAQGGVGGTPWGPGAASAESCTHPAKRDRCFPPPIAERQRLPNVGIPYVFISRDIIRFETDVSQSVLNWYGAVPLHGQFPPKE